MQLLSALGINWQLFIAQIVNLTILMLILMYFIYKPLLRLIDSRRQTIQKSMDDVKVIEQQKRDIEEFKAEQMRKADAEMSKMMDDARKQAEALKRDMADKAQQEVSAAMERGKASIDAERKKMLTEAQTSLAAFVVKLSQKLLEREFGPQDQDRLLKSVEKDLPTLIK